jgi:hypothetical protein
MLSAQPRRLDSWKAIAEYLGRNVRTAMRWAEARGMPVHRVPGGKRGSVFAFAEEIDGWLANHNHPSLEPSIEYVQPGQDQYNTPQVGERVDDVHDSSALRRPTVFGFLDRRIALVILIVIVAIAFSALKWSTDDRSMQLASVEFGADTLEAKNTDEQTIWVHKFPRQLTPNFLGTAVKSRNLTRVSDYFGDGKKEVAALVPLREGPDPNDFNQTELDFFSGTGRLLWTYRPDQTFRFGDHELKAPWVLMDIFVAEMGGRRTIWAAAAHHTWGNSFVVQIDARTGAGTLRFVNTGNLRILNELKTSSGNYLLAGGFNNEWDSGSLAVINENRAFAASPQTTGTRHECNSCPPGAPDYYFVFPRSELNRIAGAYEDSAYEIHVTDEGIEISKNEGFIGEQQRTLYLLSRETPFSVISLRYDSEYDRVHREWSAEGKLSHKLEDCPERVHPKPVRMWTPGGGWVELPVKPAAANQ